tara:strand:+ start:255 stop:1004 length:750 start_codon:yes stop_codon:yes gene_type:complete
MISHSFIFLEKISKKKERNIWQQGIRNWSDFIETKRIKGISSLKKEYYNRKIKEAQAALTNNDPSFFIDKLPKIEMWRLYNHFKEDCCFLDIEINAQGKIVIVGISDYYNTNFFVKGYNLEKSLIEKELSKYRMIITFNGSSFDLPKLRKELKIDLNFPHIDLKPLCINLGLKGGLKEVEKVLDLKRPKHLYGNPIDLWKAFHASGDREYLNLLLEYNKEDCENLKVIIDFIQKELNNKYINLINTTTL